MKKKIQKILNQCGYEIKKISKFDGSNYEKNCYKLNPNNPYLISYPRCGSHYLRLFLEEYVRKPTLPSHILHHTNKEYFLYHDHGANPRFIYNNYIYLYRDPVDAIYSYLIYNNTNTKDKKTINRFAIHFAWSLSKYCIDDNSSQNKALIVKYENLLNKPTKTFSKVLNHLKVDVDYSKINNLVEKIDKKYTNEKMKVYYADYPEGNLIVNLEENLISKKEFRSLEEKNIYDIIEQFSLKNGYKDKLINLLT